MASLSDVADTSYGSGSLTTPNADGHDEASELTVASIGAARMF